MADKLPNSVAGSDQHADVMGTEKALQEKYAWQQDRATQFHPTLTVYRFTKTGADAATHQKGSWVTTKIKDVPCWHDDITLAWTRRFGATETTGDKVFILYETDELTAIYDEDVLNFDGREYSISEFNHDEDSGRIEILAELSKG